MSGDRGYTAGSKAGVIIALIPAWTIPSTAYPALQQVSQGQDKLGNGKHGASQNDRYLIEVARESITGQGLISHFYAPTRKVIEAQNLGVSDV